MADKKAKEEGLALKFDDTSKEKPRQKLYRTTRQKVMTFCKNVFKKGYKDAELENPGAEMFGDLKKALADMEKAHENAVTGKNSDGE